MSSQQANTQDATEKKITYKWGVFDDDYISLRGPRIPDEVCDSISEAMEEAARMIEDGVYQQLCIQRVRMHKSNEYWVASTKHPEAIYIDARDFDTEVDIDD